MKKRWLAAALTLALLPAGAARAAVENIAGQCRFLVSEGSAAAITDTAMDTAWTPAQGEAEVRVMLPDSGAAWVQIHWSVPPEDYTLTEYNAQQTVVATHTAQEDAFPCIAQLLPLRPETRYVFLRFAQPGQGVNKIRVYPAGELPPTVVQWEPPLEKCDLMVVSTHQDDEWLWFGPMIPYYDLVKGKDVQVVYMADCGRLRYAEALNSLAVTGVRTYPYFVGLPDIYEYKLEDAVANWGGLEGITGTVAGVIRRFRPEVILVQAANGEYGHYQHILTSRIMDRAIAAAADPDQYPESAQEYGAWQVKKLYRHLEEKGRIVFDWHAAYPEFGGKTGIEIATAAMREHASQSGWSVEDHGEYDNAVFGLSYSTVGDDVRHDDFFENIPDATPTPEPTPEPAPEAEAAQDASAGEADVAPAQAERAAEAGKSGGPAAGAWIAVAAVVVCGGAGWALYSRAQARRRKARRKRRAQAAKRKAQNTGKKSAPKRSQATPKTR